MAVDREYMLTTTDNPYNPYTQWDQWLAYDTNKGYHTPAYLARLVYTSDELLDDDQLNAVSDAIDEIVLENILGIYSKIFKENNSSDTGGGGPEKTDPPPASPLSQK